MQFTHEVTLTLASPLQAIWDDWADIHALPRLLSHVRATAPGAGDDTARLIILLDGHQVEFAARLFLYVQSLHLETASEGQTEFILTIAYDPPPAFFSTSPNCWAAAANSSKLWKRTCCDMRRGR